MKYWTFCKFNFQTNQTQSTKYVKQHDQCFMRKAEYFKHRWNKSPNYLQATGAGHKRKGVKRERMALSINSCQKVWFSTDWETKEAENTFLTHGWESGYRFAGGFRSRWLVRFQFLYCHPPLPDNCAAHPPVKYS